MCLHHVTEPFSSSLLGCCVSSSLRYCVVFLPHAFFTFRFLTVYEAGQGRTELYEGNISFHFLSERTEKVFEHQRSISIALCFLHINLWCTTHCMLYQWVLCWYLLLCCVVLNIITVSLLRVVFLFFVSVVEFFVLCLRRQCCLRFSLVSTVVLCRVMLCRATFLFLFHLELQFWLVCLHCCVAFLWFAQRQCWISLTVH